MSPRGLGAAALLSFVSLWGCGKGEGGDPSPPPISAVVLASCVVAPYSPMNISLQTLANAVQSRGFAVTWEAHQSTYILRSRRDDHLTGEQHAIDFDVLYEPDQGGTQAPGSCGPGRAIINRIRTNDGVHDGLAVDQLLNAMAAISSPSSTPSSPQPTPSPAGGESGAEATASAFPKSGDASGTCEVKISGRILISGPCAGSYRDDGVVLSSQGAEGCHVDLNWIENGAQASVYSYRNPCVSPATGEAIDSDLSLGTAAREGRCWVNESVRVCLTR